MKCRTSREANWIRSDKQIIGISCRINVKIWHNTSHAACKSRSWLSISLLLRERVNNSSRERENIMLRENLKDFFFTFSWKKALWFITCLFSRARRAVHVPGWMNSTRCVVQEGGEALHLLQLKGVLRSTYVDISRFRSRSACCLRRGHICWNNVIEVAHWDSLLFLLQSSEPVEGTRRNIYMWVELVKKNI